MAQSPHDNRRPAARPEPREPTRFSLGDTVFMRMQPERFAGMVTGILTTTQETSSTPPGKIAPPKPDSLQTLQRPPGPMFYVTWADGIERAHFAIELTDEFEPFYG